MPNQNNTNNSNNSNNFMYGTNQGILDRNNEEFLTNIEEHTRLLEEIAVNTEITSEEMRNISMPKQVQESLMGLDDVIKQASTQKKEVYKGLEAALGSKGASKDASKDKLGMADFVRKEKSRIKREIEHREKMLSSLGALNASFASFGTLSGLSKSLKKHDYNVGKTLLDTVGNGLGTIGGSLLTTFGKGLSKTVTTLGTGLSKTVTKLGTGLANVVKNPVFLKGLAVAGTAAAGYMIGRSIFDKWIAPRMDEMYDRWWKERVEVEKIGALRAFKRKKEVRKKVATGELTKSQATKKLGQESVIQSMIDDLINAKFIKEDERSKYEKLSLRALHSKYSELSSKVKTVSTGMYGSVQRKRIRTLGAPGTEITDTKIRRYSDRIKALDIMVKNREKEEREKREKKEKFDAMFKRPDMSVEGRIAYAKRFGKTFKEVTNHESPEAYVKFMKLQEKRYEVMEKNRKLIEKKEKLKETDKEELSMIAKQLVENNKIMKKLASELSKKETQATNNVNTQSVNTTNNYGPNDKTNLGKAVSG